MANPEGSETIGACVTLELGAEITKLAKLSDLSRSGYVRYLLIDAVKRKRVFKLRVEEWAEDVNK